LKNGCAAAQKSFSLKRCAYHMMIKNKHLTSALERRKTFDLRHPWALRRSVVQGLAAAEGFLLRVNDRKCVVTFCKIMN
jgi:hypothetical protein